MPNIEKWHADGKLLIGKMTVIAPDLQWSRHHQELSYDYNVGSAAGFSIGGDVAYELTEVLSIGAEISYLRTVSILIGGYLTKKTLNRRPDKPDLISKEGVRGYEYEAYFDYLRFNISFRFKLNPTVNNKPIKEPDQ